MYIHIHILQAPCFSAFLGMPSLPAKNIPAKIC